MKKTLSKIFLTSLCVLIMFFCVACLSSCSLADFENAKIYLENYESQAILVDVGEFKFEDYTVVAEYEDGEIKTATLTEDMISELDQMCFYKIGEHELTINAFKSSGTFKINVVRKSFSNISFESQSIVYDKKEHSIEVSGMIPSGTTVSYIPSNTFISTGTYNITAVLTNADYQTIKLYATLTIEKAEYDMSNVTLMSDTYDYDGLRKYIAISGEMPRDVSVSYTINGIKGNSAIDAGVYEVVANFSSNNSNYKQIPSMNATLTINKAQYDIHGLSMQDESFIYDTMSKSITLTGKIPNGLTLSYQIRRIKDANGNDVEEAFAVGNSATDAGSYEIVATLTKNNVNYDEIEPFVAILTIEKADFELSSYEMTSVFCTYDTLEHSIVVSGEPTADENKKYSNISVSYKIDDNDGNCAVNAGEYIVYAIISQDNDNYENSFVLSAYLVIEKASYENVDFILPNASYYYDGEAKSIVLKDELPNGLNVSYQIRKVEDENGDEVDEDFTTGNSATEVGVYEIIAIFSSKDGNYETPSQVNGILTIMEVV